MGNQVCGVKLMSPGGREVAPSGGEREDAGPGLLTVSGAAGGRSNKERQRLQPLASVG